MAVEKRKVRKAVTKAKGKRVMKARTVKARKVGAKASKKRAPGAAKKALPAMEKLGEVSHYFPKVKAAAVKVMKDSIKVGDEIYIKGHTTDFKEKVTSIQLDHASIPEGKKGMEIGLLVKSRVRIGDTVYKV